MPPREHSAILSTFIKLPFVIKTSVLSIFEWPLNIGFTVYKEIKGVRGGWLDQNDLYWLFKLFP